MDILTKKCVPCESSMPPLTLEQINYYMQSIPGWELENMKLVKNFTFKNFIEASAWLEHIKFLSEKEGHHPDIHWHYNKITLELWTHAINGLSENDFILAAKINAIKS